MTAHALKVDVYSHHIRISDYGWEVKNALVDYCKKLAKWGPVRGHDGSIHKEIKNVYIAVWANRRAFFFLRSQMEDVLQWIERHGILRETMLIEEHPLYLPTTVELKLLRDVTLHGYQETIVNFILEPGSNKLVPLYTGYGKTFVGLQVAYLLQVRTAIILKPMYIDKWVEDVKGFFDLKPGDLMIISGSQNLKRLFEQARDGVLKAKIIIISNATYRIFLDEYEMFSGGENTFEMDAEKMYESLGVGYRILDEAHQDFHFNYRMDSYTHCPKTVALSATMDSDDVFMNDRYYNTYPAGTHAPVPVYDAYIAVQSIIYEMESLKGIRTKNFFGMFNHILFEESIMRDKGRMERYKDMIEGIIEADYIKKCPPGTPMLVFFASVEMCTIMARYLQECFPDKKVNRYVGEDDYEDLLKADIGVTTLKSAGTAVDIPNLSYVLMTVFVSSKQANLQGLGRLRRLKDYPDYTPNFAYLTCRNISKSVQYDEEKREKFKGKVVGHNLMQTHHRI